MDANEHCQTTMNFGGSRWRPLDRPPEAVGGHSREAPNLPELTRACYCGGAKSVSGAHLKRITSAVGRGLRNRSLPLEPTLGQMSAGFELFLYIS